MTTPDGVSRCRLAPMRDLVFTTPTGKGRELCPLIVTPPAVSRTRSHLSPLCVLGGQIELSQFYLGWR